jgi:FkbM family methyltransferase
MAARRQLVHRGPSRRAFEAAYLFYKRYFEAGSPKRLAPFIVEGSTVIDVGANIGFYSVPFARWVGPRGRLIAIEPEALNKRRLAARIAAAGVAGRSLLFEAAAAEKSGRQWLAINPEHPGDHKLADRGTAAGMEIDAHALDDLLVAHPGPPVSLIKIDVQGAELRVIRGARELLGRDRPALLVEIDPTNSESADELLALLDELDYAFHIWTRRGPGARQRAGTILAMAKAAGYLDVFCINAGD